jgi:DNA-binding transcriptional ArsR family regulator/YHS domain-containing protein
MYERLFQLQEEILKTLANQKRLEILQLLIKRELTVSEMVEMLGISQANLSQHLSQLRRLKLVTTRKAGLYVYYRLTDKRVANILGDLREFLKTHYAHEPEVAGISSLDNNNIYPLVKDPVCGMRMSMSEVGESVSINNEQYYFCAGGCLKRFTANPSQFTSSAKALPKSGSITSVN